MKKKSVGIIAEYNPFHNGHLYHLNESKKLTDAEISIVAMSGKKGINSNLTSVVMAYGKDDIIAYNAAGELVPSGKTAIPFLITDGSHLALRRQNITLFHNSRDTLLIQY